MSRHEASIINIFLDPRLQDVHTCVRVCSQDVILLILTCKFDPVFPPGSMVGEISRKLRYTTFACNDISFKL